MSLTVSLTPESEARLRLRAAAEGAELAAYASKLLELAVAKQSLQEVLAPLRQEFASSGTTDEALLAQIVSARDAYRAER